MIRRLIESQKALRESVRKLEETCEIRTPLVAPLREKIDERRRASVQPQETEAAPNGA
jgi:hypothetical protein